MSLAITREVANALGLQAGRDVGPSSPLSSPKMAVYEAAAARLMTYSAKSLEPFWHELGAVYLPSLLRTFFLNSFGLDLPLLSIKYFTAVLRLSINLLMPGTNLSRHIERFCRARPEEVISFIHIQLQRLAGVDQEESDLLENNQDFFQAFFRVPGYLFENLRTVFGSNELYAICRRAVSEVPLSVVSRVDNLRRHVLVEPDLSRLLGASAILKMGLKPTLALDFSSLPSWEASILCEANLERETRTGEHCEKPVEGMELPECGRCRAVRYCSRDHQKRHWKQHKPTCFPPGW